MMHWTSPYRYPSDVLKLVHNEARMVSKRAVGILQECSLVFTVDMSVPYQSNRGAQISTLRITKYVTLYPLVSSQTKLGTVYSKLFRHHLH